MLVHQQEVTTSPSHIHSIPNQISYMVVLSNKSPLPVPECTRSSYYPDIHIPSLPGPYYLGMVQIDIFWHVYRFQISPSKYPTERNQKGIDVSGYLNYKTALVYQSLNYHLVIKELWYTYVFLVCTKHSHIGLDHIFNIFLWGKAWNTITITE